jgi:hypothetical protein
MTSVDKIFEEENKEKKEQIKKEIIKDTEDILKSGIKVFNDLFESEKRKKVAKINAQRVKSKWGWRFRILSRLFLLGLLVLIIINFVLFNIWILKIFIKGIF